MASDIPFYDNVTKLLNVNPNKGMVIRRIFDKTMADAGKTLISVLPDKNIENCSGGEDKLILTNDYTWDIGTLILHFGSRSGRYEVYFSEDHPDYPLIMRVNKKYNVGAFENIFALGCECRNWHPDTTIGIVS